MSQINIGDYVIFEHEGSKMTGLVKEVVATKDSISYRIVPSAIGMDYCPVVDKSKVKKAQR